jgi:ankyrin repeat protein
MSTDFVNACVSDTSDQLTTLLQDAANNTIENCSAGLFKLTESLDGSATTDVLSKIELLFNHQPHIINLYDEHGCAPIHYACLAIGHAASAPATTEEFTSKTMIINKLFQLGADINLPVTNQTASLPLHLACLNQNYNIVKFLLDHGVDVNAANNNNMTPLFFTLHNENIIKLLFDHHADMNHKDSNNDTPLGAWTKNLKQDGQQFEAAHQMLLACGATL